MSCKRVFHVNNWIPWSLKSGASLVNGVKEHYWVRNEYAIFCSIFLSNLWVHENCVHDRMLKKALWTNQIRFLMGIQVYTCIIIPIWNCMQKVWSFCRLGSNTIHVLGNSTCKDCLIFVIIYELMVNDVWCNIIYEVM